MNREPETDKKIGCYSVGGAYAINTLYHVQYIQISERGDINKKKI